MIEQKTKEEEIEELVENSDVLDIDSPDKGHTNFISKAFHSTIIKILTRGKNANRISKI